MATMTEKISHAKSGCPDCAIIKTLSNAHTSGFFYDVRISKKCREIMDEKNEPSTTLVSQGDKNGS